MEKDDILTIAEENRVRGAVERVYALSDNVQKDGNELLKEKGSEGLLLMFTRFMTGLLTQFHEYAGRPDADLQHDGVGFTTCPINATVEELNEAMRKIGEILVPLMQNPPAEGRQRHSIAVITTPPEKKAADE